MADKIKTFDDISRIHRLDHSVLEGIKKRLADSMAIKPESVGFTGLQRQAFNTPGFWLEDNEDDRHIIVQGATSAGKTLVSEMAILDTLKDQKKCIVLVPLRAMVRERWIHFKNDFELRDTERVYASSSDYQDHDGEIINGEFTVAIIVYEKFFVMLAQSQNNDTNKNMLEQCGLLVVDELQMLNNSNRGPKLEIAIQKVLRNNALRNDGINTRIMCLTTSDCRVNFIERWLTIDGREPLLLINNDRPTSLIEHVIQFDGRYQALPIEGEDGSAANIEFYGKNVNQKTDDEGELLYYEGEIEIPDYGKNLKSEEKKKRLLKALLNEIYSQNPEAKVLVFVNGRNRTKMIARYIADTDILPSLDMTSNLREIYRYDDDDYQQFLARTLLPRRVACHNAAIATGLREFVEGLFGSADDPLKLVVATETLTIGMNMPVDVMILYDHEIRRTDGSQHLTNQEYKNFVGRAGRLGQKNMKGGRSFIFAADMDERRYFWDRYVNCRPQDIKSSLMRAGTKFQAPYYLALLNVGQDQVEYTPQDLDDLWRDSFSRNCDGRPLDVKNVCEELRRARLAKLQDDRDDDDEDDDIITKRYKLTEYGKRMTPYAFHLDTCKKIHRYFFNGGYVLRKKIGQKEKEWRLVPGKGGLPFSTTTKDLEPEGYLLDILYVLCTTPEVVNIGQLRLPSPDVNPSDSREAKDRVEETLKEMFRAGKCKFWTESPLKQMVNGEYDWSSEQFDKMCLMRAIILWHWTQGERIDQIRRETKFKVPLVVGDIARLAETVAYQLEAISRMDYRGKEVFTGFQWSDVYRLSTRVNYGVSQELVSIANRHVHALERKVVLEIGDLYKKREFDYTSPMAMLRMPINESDWAEIDRIIPKTMLEDLLKSADDSNMHESIEQLLTGIKNDPPSGRPFGKAEHDALKNLYSAKMPDDEKYLLSQLRKIFSEGTEEDSEPAQFFDDNIVLDFPTSDENIATLQFGNKTFILIAPDADLNEIKEKEYKHQVKRVAKNGAFKVIVLTTETAENEKLRQTRQKFGEILSDIEGARKRLLTTTFGAFIGLITQSIKLTDFHGVTLSTLLWDTCGTFHKPLKSFNWLLQNYERHSVSTPKNYKALDGQRVRLLCDKRRSVALEELKGELDKNRIAYRELSWGEDLIAERDLDEPTLLFLDWSTVRSCVSLDYFVNGLARRDYRQTYAIFESEKAFKAWGGDPESPCFNLEHCESTKNFRNDIGTTFKALLRTWRDKKYLVGISYAHEQELGQERDAVELLNEFVELMQEELPEQTVFFDRNSTAGREFHGNSALSATLEQYSQCEYFVILDDHHYDNSDICEAECTAIQNRLSEMKATGIDISKRLWLLHPKNVRHCKFYTEFRKNGGYCTEITSKNIYEQAQKFIEMLTATRK